MALALDEVIETLSVLRDVPELLGTIEQTDRALLYRALGLQVSYRRVGSTDPEHPDTYTDRCGERATAEDGLCDACAGRPSAYAAAAGEVLGIDRPPCREEDANRLLLDDPRTPCLAVEWKEER